MNLTRKRWGMYPIEWAFALLCASLAVLGTWLIWARPPEPMLVPECGGRR